MNLMKSALKVLIFTLAITLILTPSPNAMAQESIRDFHHRMNTVFKQADSDTLLQQIIFGSLEVFTTFKIGSFITEPDRKEITAISLQIRALEESRKTNHIIMDQLSDRERNARISQLKRRLRVVEGGLGQHLSRGTAKFFIRGAQVLLVLDFGSRIYVLTTLDHRDPQTLPLKTLFCSEVDCRSIAYEVLGINHRTHDSEIVAPLPVHVPAPATSSPNPNKILGIDQ